MKDFSDRNNEAIWGLVKKVKEIMDSLRQDLPIEKLDWSTSQDENDGSMTVTIWGTGFNALNSFLIYLHPLDSAPEPKELYPDDCVATGTLRINLAEEFELCSSGESWMIHCQDKWIPFSRHALAFLIGKAQNAPANLRDDLD